MENTTELQKPRKTILVVDDDPTILALVSELLVAQYNVLTSITSSSALQQSRDHKGDIDLLLSDFQMRGLAPMDLATEMTIERPKLKVLLMSDFPGGMLILNEGWHFLMKPFIPSQLRTLISGLLSPDKPSRFSK
jgi:two-component system cell cycle response regulator CpdR